MRKQLTISAAVLATIVGALAACAEPDYGAFDGAEGGDAGPAECKAREKEACTCADGKASTKTCSSAGRFLECACEPVAAVCGNGTCDPGETCKTCPGDCGPCPTCAEARSCRIGAGSPALLKKDNSLDVKLEQKPKERILADLVSAAERGAPGLVALSAAMAADRGANPRAAQLRSVLAQRPTAFAALERQLARPELAVPLARSRIRATTHASIAGKAIASQHTMSGDAGAFPDGGFGDAGAVQCEPAKLVLRVASVTVTEEDDDFANDIVYCLVSAEGPGGSEGKTLPKTPNLDEGESHAWSSAEGTFWGQKAKPHDPGGDLSVRYDCFEEDKANGYAEFLQAVGKLVLDANTDKGYEIGDDGYVTPTEGGWEGATADLALQYLPQLLALDGDDHLFTATQVIPRTSQLALAEGATWGVRKKGTHFWSDWDWTLKVEAWGCADNGRE